MSDIAGNPVAEAAARLEAAVDRLAQAAERARAALDEASAEKPAGEPVVEGVPKEQVAAIAARLDATIARLRGALGEDGAEAPEEGE